jgi:hypothetical protein
MGQCEAIDLETRDGGGEDGQQEQIIEDYADPRGVRVTG